MEFVDYDENNSSYNISNNKRKKENPDQDLH